VKSSAVNREGPGDPPPWMGSSRRCPRHAAGCVAALRELIEAGRLVPAVDRTYTLSETGAAIRQLRDGRARGKVVISIARA
jgi:NADPH:quinone reductase-like Zn-dependent oxidoreductase